MAWGNISAGQNRLLRRCNWRKRHTIGPLTEFHCFKGNPIDFVFLNEKPLIVFFANFTFTKVGSDERKWFPKPFLTIIPHGLGPQILY